jgi:hypothetical protein
MVMTVYMTIVSITVILAASILLVTLPEFGNSGIAQGQGNNMTSPSLTPQQKAAMCNPNDKFVNDTESSVCGIPPGIGIANTLVPSTFVVIHTASSRYEQYGKY